MHHHLVFQFITNKELIFFQKITQLAAQPTAKAVGLLRWFNGKWESVPKGFTATKLTWSVTSSTVMGMGEQYPLAMTIESNCTLSNPREMGKKSDGNRG